MELRKEDRLLLAQLEDKLDRCRREYRMVHSHFLDPRQRALAANRFQNHRELAAGGMQCVAHGGYPDAERVILLFLPDYLSLPLSPEEDPLSLLRLTQKGQQTLSHRDYLGALTGLGVKREIAGDILVRENGADLIVLSEMADYLAANFEQAGRVTLTARKLLLSDLILPEGRREEFRDTVASLRLDNLVAAAFSISRSDAAEAIQRGLVSVNSLILQKPDAPVREGDRIVSRGKGKVLLAQVGGTTKKGRISVTLERFV